MSGWVLPAVVTALLWGLYGFLPKLTTEYISPASAIIFEILGGMLVGIGALVYMGCKPEMNTTGIALAAVTGFVGILGAFTYLLAAQSGRVSLVAATVALYPVVTILLGALVLKEPISLKEGVGMVMAIAALLVLSS